MYLQVGDPGSSLTSVAIAVGGRGGRGQIIGRYAACVPIGPVNTVGLDVNVHSINANICISLENLLIAPVWHARVQATNLVVICNVEHLPQT